LICRFLESIDETIIFFTFAKTLSPLRLTIYYANKTFILHINNCSRGSFFIPFIGSSHLFDWDEINFAESAREMILTGNYATVQINYMPFWEKPPLFFWMQVLAMKAFNVFDPNSGFAPEFGARFPNAIIGIITLLVFYRIGRKLYNEKFGLLWALGYLGSFTPHLYFKSGIIDPTFNLFIFLGVWYFSQSVSTNQNTSKRQTYGLLSGLFVGLAILTKGPVGGLLWGLTVFTFWGVNGFSASFLKDAIKPFFSAIAIAFWWLVFGLDYLSIKMDGVCL
jgi:4-amino-4-deoxy-L-arabinose transferase-like glycosyltransferase